MGVNLVGQAVLQRAVVKLGGAEAVAERIAISPSLLASYLDGYVPVPQNILLRAVEIVFEDLPGILREVQAPPPRPDT